MSSIEDFKIPLQEILSATDRFSKANVIALGGFGKVYRGRSKQHGMLAIKRLDRSHGQGDREFNTEIAMLSAYKHENLVALVGFCEEGREKILVYKYETNGSLDKFLSEKDLTWELRLQIGIGSARGLRYLHDQIGPGHRVIHRDLKSSNILLDENLNPKISDFGLAKIGLANVLFSVQFSNPCGTFGYVDPEFLRGILTQKSDVYSFGVVLFELLFGKLVCLPPRVDDHHFTVEMARIHYENNTLDEMIDPDLRSQMTTASLRTFSTIAYQCVKDHRDHRPTMRLVLEQLEKALHQYKASSGFSHDVYICVKEDDIRPYFAKKLCAALEKQGLSVYRDNLIDAYGPYLNTKERYSRNLRLFLYTNAYKRLQEALEKSPALSVQLTAIEQSRSSIIIFSKRFVRDLKKLDEVVKIMECLIERKQFVLPIFYQVDPSNVRKQERVMDLIALRYGRIEEHGRIKELKKARIEAANIQGGIEFQSRDFEWSDLDKVASIIKHQLSGRGITKLEEKVNRHQS